MAMMLRVEARALPMICPLHCPEHPNQPTGPVIHSLCLDRAEKTRELLVQFMSIGGYSWNTLAAVTNLCRVKVRGGSFSPASRRNASGSTS
jgi:hypothetical protein